MQNYYRGIEPRVSLEAASLFLRDRGKVVYILPSSDPTLALLLVGFTEYDHDDVLSSNNSSVEIWAVDGCKTHHLSHAP
ncbi:hypothetical protein Hanom_Chr14g01258591 [Helianthus anomalus]